MNLDTLNSALHAELERLNNPDLKGDGLKEEINRAEAINKIGGTIVNNARLALDAQVKIKEYQLGGNTALKPLGIK